ncbi:BamA/TamA family outer membrane protein [Scandinavium hiltneri]|uniref:BamA/TamA family outer membrane protein n=1 Tax=Scandinavium hiltneri TaxID=2926519 RepID=UPI0035AF6315
MILRLLAVALLLISCGRSFAAGMFDPQDGMFDMSDYLRDNPYGFLPVPMMITEPAIGYGGGLFGLFLHGKGSMDGDHFIPPNMSGFGGGATENGTWFAGAGHRHTWNNDHIRYLVGAGYANINLDIYSGDVLGFGKNRAINTNTKGYGALQRLQFRVGDSPVFLGVTQIYARTEISADNNKLINAAWQRVFGSESTSSAVGLMAEYDTTDNFFYPHKGLSLSAEYRFYSSFLGGDYRYNQLTLDGKYFLPLSPTLTLALAGDYQALSNSDQHLPPMTRPDINLRGISRYRYQGDYVGTVQTQLAWQVTPRWILQGFVGAGSAANDNSDLFSSSEVAWGTGFRYLIARKYGLYTGADIAFSEGDQAVYFNVGSGL